MASIWLDDPEVRLMLDVSADRSGAFEDLVVRCSGALVNFLYRQVGNPEDAEDLAQEVFARVFRARHSYEPTARFRTWLLTIATHLSLNLKRHERFRFHFSLDAPRPEAGETLPIDLEDARAPAPEDGLERGEVAARVRAAVQRLPANQRTALSLLRFEGLSYREIAGVLKISLKATKSLLNRAKENLRALLAREVKDYLDGQIIPMAADWRGTS